MDHAEALTEINGWLDNVTLSSGRCSTIIRNQLAAHLCDRTYNVYSIMDEIRRIEGLDKRPSMTKPATKFRSPPLKGLWHKHHFQARFLEANILAHWLSPQNESRLQAICNEFNQEGDHGKLAHRLVLDAHEKRAGSHKTTGEWIVFAPYAGINYYLTLRRHDEDSLIRADALLCLVEFPQLAAVLNR